MVYMPLLPAALRRKNHNVPGHPGHVVSRQSMTLDSKSEGLLVLASAVITEKSLGFVLFVLIVQSFIRILNAKSVFVFTMEKFDLIFQRNWNVKFG